MTKLLQTLAVSALMLTPAPAAHAQVSFGVRIGEPPAPRVYRVPPQPERDYVWVEGYYYPQGSHYRWHDGYWTRPPYAGAYWVAPYHVGGQCTAAAGKAAAAASSMTTAGTGAKGGTNIANPGAAIATKVGASSNARTGGTPSTGSSCSTLETRREIAGWRQRCLAWRPRMLRQRCE